MTTDLSSNRYLRPKFSPTMILPAFPRRPLKMLSPLIGRFQNKCSLNTFYGGFRLVVGFFKPDLRLLINDAIGRNQKFRHCLLYAIGGKMEKVNWLFNCGIIQSKCIKGDLVPRATALLHVCIKNPLHF